MDWTVYGINTNSKKHGVTWVTADNNQHAFTEALKEFKKFRPHSLVAVPNAHPVSVVAEPRYDVLRRDFIPGFLFATWVRPDVARKMYAEILEEKPAWHVYNPSDDDSSHSHRQAQTQGGGDDETNDDCKAWTVIGYDKWDDTTLAAQVNAENEEKATRVFVSEKTKEGFDLVGERNTGKYTSIAAIPGTHPVTVMHKSSLLGLIAYLIVFAGVAIWACVTFTAFMLQMTLISAVFFTAGFPALFWGVKKHRELSRFHIDEVDM